MSGYVERLTIRGMPPLYSLRLGNQTKMRINVTGNAGSGKSTLSQTIAKELDLLLIEMDCIIWQPGWQRTPSDISRRELSKLLLSDRWVLDGVSRMGRQQADLIVFLDFPRRVCAWRCAKRNWRYLFSSRPGLPEHCPEWRIILTLTKIIWLFPDLARPAILRDMESPTVDAIAIQDKDDLKMFVKHLSELKIDICQKDAL